MRTIAIDFEVHKLIEMERTSFDETPNAALRRLLGLPRSSARTEGDHAKGPGWTCDGVHLPDGTQLRMSYSGRSHRGEIDGGTWLVEGQRFRSPSGAASGVARTRSGKHPRLDGWIYWEALLPGTEEWIRILELRSRVLRTEAHRSTDTAI
ncbi:hypothetical protein [Phenylobacterium deserti]|uniref:hypothetical protein n=1 Tax=Phenylobacterium deserti TaxID=1914756 RepID=UPI0010580813|nr:hypothetical protein [Phenylobacterium deserti]